ncbi:MAG: nuclear transport factor 2 family protein [Paracoccaceae bacterium]
MSDDTAIRTTVFDYFDGYFAKDRVKLESAFALDIANMMGIEDSPTGDATYSVSIRDQIDRWCSPDRPAMEFGPGRILSLQLFGDAGAMVLFDFGGKFLDSLQLAKVDGRWKIVNKFFVVA